MSDIASEPSRPQTEEEWQAYSDATVIINATTIFDDEDRMKAAKPWIESMVEDAENKVKATKKALRKVK